MKVSLNWVKEYAHVKLPFDELVQKIGRQLGAVEEVIDLGKKYQGIVITKVVTCEKHPNADKLSVCKIDDGGKIKGVKRDDKKLVQVVCGAPNVRAGMLVAWLPPGAIVPATYDKDPFKLEAREIRDVVSNGMLASASELAISDDHTGIVELHDGKPGDDFAKTLGLDDHIIDIENKMFTHRPDCFGILGVAREIAGIQNISFKSPHWYTKVENLEPKSNDLKVVVKNELPKLVRRFIAVPLSVTHNGPSPFWLQTYLSRVGLRPINVAVDITNYLMHLTGQPMHAYDYDKVMAQDPGASQATLTIRYPKAGEELTLLGGKKIKPHDKAIMIATSTKAIGIGGVMGGADTEVDEKTKNIILECANFDMYSVRKTAMEHGLFTDAVTRFTKGQSALQNDYVAAYAVSLFRQFASGQVAGQVSDKQATLSHPKAVRVAPSFVNERLGLSLSAAKMTQLLENVEFRVLKAPGKQIAVSPPFWRTDIEIPEDIVEEIGRLYGYDHLPVELPKRTIRPTDRSELFDLKATIRDILSKAGANEVLTYSFVHGDLLDKVGQDKAKAFQLSNAISPDLQYYRLSLIPSLLDKVHANIKAGFDEFAIFELGKAHTKDAATTDKENVPKEFENLALVFATNDKSDGGAAYYETRAFLDYLATELGVSLRYEPVASEPDYIAAKPFDHTRSARIYVDDKLIGLVGEFKPEVQRALKLPSRVAGFEIGIGQHMQAKRTYQPIPRFPKVQQDITLKVSADIPFGELNEWLEQELQAAQPEDTVASLSPLDIYQKQKQKNYTFRLTIASHIRTMTDAEVNALLDELAAKAQVTLGAERV